MIGWDGIALDRIEQTRQGMEWNGIECSGVGWSGMAWNVKARLDQIGIE